MKRIWLMVDVSSLAHRAMHATGELQYGEKATGVLFGVLREVFALQDRFKAFSLVPCFDHGKGIREQSFSFYKETRRKRKLTDDQLEMYDSMRHQLKRLRTDIFPRLGCRNVLWQDGYEGDDLIAAACHALPNDDGAVIVTGDKDLYQLITANVSVYHPISQKLVTKKAFRREWGLGPGQWANIKALAGCGTDDVTGVDGVAEKTAAKFYRGELPKTHKVYKEIVKFVGSKDHRTNLALVTLPFAGTKKVTLQPDNLDLEARREILDELGIRAFA